MNDGNPVELILPAFPAKSPSPRKVLGTLPDLAEERALRYLQRVCDRLAETYPPGVRLIICSDGLVFSDVVGVRDADVTAYGRELRHIIKECDLHSLSLFDLSDAFGGTSYESMRRRLSVEYAETLQIVRKKIRSEPAATRMYNGIHRFLVEDLAGVRPDWSRSRLRSVCRERAYELIQRSNAWGRLIAERFPGALRLSIHPQHPHDDKIGIRLADGASDVWITPWHSVALVDATDAGHHRLVHRHEAERLGGRLVYHDGRPNHFALEVGAPGTEDLATAREPHHGLVTGGVTGQDVPGD
ncbi:MAG TPA: isocyanide synthase family protein [Micromonosporaceae bacterium]